MAGIQWPGNSDEDAVTGALCSDGHCGSVTVTDRVEGHSKGGIDGDTVTVTMTVCSDGMQTGRHPEV